MEGSRLTVRMRDLLKANLQAGLCIKEALQMFLLVLDWCLAACETYHKGAGFFS